MPLFGLFGNRSHASDPGGFAISHEKLKALRPDLFPSPGIRGQLTNWLFNNSDIRSFEYHLQNGDTRAAVVVMLDPLLVAAYTDELDCVAILEFPDAFVEQYELSEGTRLLTVNRYRPDAPLDDDLIPGPDHTKRYYGFVPIIADFLTDSRDQIEHHRRRIDEAEWKRALLMGREYLTSRPGTARDGSPGPSGQSETPPRFRWLIISLLLCVASILVEFLTVGQFLALRAIESWSTTKGIIKHSDLQPNAINSNFTAQIKYEYTVAEKQHLSSSVRVEGTTFDSKAKAVEITQRFPVNSDVLVYYNPQSPSESFLETGVGWTNYVTIISPVIFSLLFGSAFWSVLQSRWISKRKRQRRLAKLFGDSENSTQ